VEPFPLREVEPHGLFSNLKGILSLRPRPLRSLSQDLLGGGHPSKDTSLLFWILAPGFWIPVLILVINSGLRFDSLSIGMLNFRNFTHRIRQFDHLRMGIPSRQNKMHQSRNGLSNLLVMTGDFPLYGFEGEAKPVYDLDSVQLIRFIHQMNEGLDIDRKAPGGGIRLPPTHFFKGCTVLPF